MKNNRDYNVFNIYNQEQSTLKIKPFMQMEERVNWNEMIVSMKSRL